MNRHDRRKAASQARRGDTMGRGYTVLPDVPARIKESEAYQAGQRGELPAGYYQGIEDAAHHIERWLAARPSPPDLRWLEWDAGRTFVAAGLDVGVNYLADSDDARALIAWLDDVTERKLSLNQAGWALRLVGQIPMPRERG